jgi:predicted nucleotidyltransferase
LSEYERQAITRGNAVRLGGVDVRFVALEDLVVMKVVAGRPRDLEDVAAVLRKNPGFDRSHIERWLGDFDSELEGKFLPAFEQVLSRIEAEGHRR